MTRSLAGFLAALCLFPALARAQAPEPPTAEAPPELISEEIDPGYLSVPNPAFPSPEVHAVPIERGQRFERADLAPYFAEGKQAEARAAYDRFDFNRARALLDSEGESSPVRYLRALAALKALDFAFASKEFELLAQVYSPLSDRCRIWAGQAYEGLKAWDDAARVYAEVSASSRQAADASLGLARSKRATRDWAGARAALEPYLERPPPPWGRDLGAEALLALADLGQAKGDKKLEREALLALWSKHPLALAARRAEARLGDLAAVGDQALVARADALIEAHRNAEGARLVAPLLERLKLPEPLACRAHFAAGKAERKLRQHAKAVATLSAVVAQCTDPELKVRALYTLGFSRTVLEVGQAPKTYEALAREFPEHGYADDALFSAADAYLKAGRVDPALERLLEVVERYPRGDQVAEALFRLFWIFRRQGETEVAQSVLEEIRLRFVASDDTYELERADYWSARLLEEAGQAGEAAEHFARLARAHPASYYGLMAREKVAALDPKGAARLEPQLAAAQRAADPFPLEAGPVAQDPTFQSAVELLRLGFNELVPLELLGIDRSSLPPQSVRLMVLMMSIAGEQRAAHGLARLWLRRDLSGPITAERRAVFEIAYPNAFRELVVKHAASAANLDPDLLQALMREESALDPKALSWAGAMGLCQLMPPTAAEVAAQLKLKRPSTAALLEPDLNIQLGATYLSGLVGRFKGAKPYAIASYNAGEGAVGRWRRERPNLPIDVWVEEIPLVETRGYVKRVLRSYNTYKLLYSGQLASTAGTQSASK